MSVDRPCEVCGSVRSEHLYDVNGFPVVRCRECGLVYVGRVPRPHELISLYDERYYEDADTPGYIGYAAAEERKRHHDRSLLRQLERYCLAGDLFEIGCAYGYFLDEARQRGWRVRGVDPSAHAVRYAREHFHLNVAGGTFSELPTEPESVDAIVLWDVIEHLPNPRVTVEAAFKWLRPGGALGLSTGDIGSLSARLHGADWSLMTPPWHQFYFSRTTLRRLLENGGLELLSIRGDGRAGVDSTSSNPRIRGPLASVLTHPGVTRLARKLGAGAIMFAFARKPSP